MDNVQHDASVTGTESQNVLWQPLYQNSEVGNREHWMLLWHQGSYMVDTQEVKTCMMEF